MKKPFIALNTDRRTPLVEDPGRDWIRFSSPEILDLECGNLLIYQAETNYGKYTLVVGVVEKGDQSLAVGTTFEVEPTESKEDQEYIRGLLELTLGSRFNSSVVFFE
jgi:hypothetical protein